MSETLELVAAVNRCQVEKMDRAGKELDPAHGESCAIFASHVRNVQAATINTYQLIAFVSIREEDPGKAAELWRSVRDLCSEALNVLFTLKSYYPHCGTPELYDLTLDYRAEAEKRYYQCLEDSECLKMPTPEGLFPKTS